MKLKKIHQTPPSTKTLYSLLPLKTRSLKFQKPTPFFCYVLPKATINHYRAEEVEKHSYIQQNQLSR